MKKQSDKRRVWFADTAPVFTIYQQRLQQCKLCSFGSSQGDEVSKDDWRTLELVANIQRGLAPNVKVEHDVKLVGRITGAKRQVDVLVRMLAGDGWRSRVTFCHH